MSKALATQSHRKLTTEALPQAIDVLVETMLLDPWDVTQEIVKGETITVKKFNGRINSQRLRAALGTVQVVERLGDQELRRQAGGQLKQVLDMIKQERPELFKKPKVIEG